MPLITRILAVTALLFVLMLGSVVLAVRQTVSNTMTDQAKTRVNQATTLALALAATLGKPTLQHGQLYYGTRLFDGYEGFVDAVKNGTGVDDSVFKVEADGQAHRIATTVMENGKRALGTLLTGPAAVAFTHGQVYTGVAPVLGTDFEARYTPIVGADGKPLGVIATAQSLASISSTTNQIFVEVFLIGGAALLISLGLLFLVLRPIGRAVSQVAFAARGLSKGDLNQQIQVQGEDEVGEMANAFRAMISYQKQAVAEVEDRTNKLISAEAAAREKALQLEQSVTQLVEDLAPATDGDLTIRPHLSAEAGDVAVVADFTGVLISTFADVARSVRLASNQVQQNSEQLTARVQQLARKCKQRTEQVTGHGQGGRPDRRLGNQRAEQHRAGYPFDPGSRQSVDQRKLPRCRRRSSAWTPCEPP